MGKFKDGLVKLQKTAAEMQTTIDNHYADLSTTATSLTNAGMRFSGGYETMYIYLTEKFKKNGDEIGKNLNKTLKDVFDPTLATFIKEIEAARLKGLEIRAAFDKVKNELKAVLKTKGEVSTQIAALNTSLEKKKKKLIQTKSYKAKVANYQSTLQDLAATIDDWGKGLNQAFAVPTPALFANKLSVDTTVKAIGDCAGGTVDGELKGLKEQAEGSAKKFRSRNIKSEVEFIKKWVAEADDMEAQSEGT